MFRKKVLQLQTLEIDLAIRIVSSAPRKLQGRKGEDVKRLYACPRQLQDLFQSAWKRTSGEVQVNLAILPDDLSFDAYKKLSAATEYALRFTGGRGIQNFILRKEEWEDFRTFDGVLEHPEV
jgi:hypothetical protein